jgi:hypothetical protein
MPCVTPLLVGPPAAATAGWKGLGGVTWSLCSMAKRWRVKVTVTGTSAGPGGKRAMVPHQRAMAPAERSEKARTAGATRSGRRRST